MEALENYTETPLGENFWQIKIRNGFQKGLWRNKILFLLGYPKVYIPRRSSQTPGTKRNKNLKLSTVFKLMQVVA
jgi:hypothetical protein